MLHTEIILTRGSENIKRKMLRNTQELAQFGETHYPLKLCNALEEQFTGMIPQGIQ